MSHARVSPSSHTPAPFAFGPAVAVACPATPSPAGAYDLVVVAASLGGREALARVLAALPPDFPTPMLVAQHLAPDSPGLYVELLARALGPAGPRVAWAADGLRPEPGGVYVAPVGSHLSVTTAGDLPAAPPAAGRAPASCDPAGAPHRTRQIACALRPGPRVNFARPAADVLFASAAAACGPRVLAVVLTGRLHDGAAGAAAVRAAGGVVLAQEPATCRAPGMPQAAIARRAAHFVLPPDAIGHALTVLAAVPGAPALFGVASTAAGTRQAA